MKKGSLLFFTGLDWFLDAETIDAQKLGDLVDGGPQESQGHGQIDSKEPPEDNDLAVDILPQIEANH